MTRLKIITYKYVIQSSNTFFYLCSPYLQEWQIEWRNFKEIFFGVEWMRNLNINIVKWNTICTSIQDGGLEVKIFWFFNQALLGKRLWLYVMEENAFWRKMIDTKYGISRGMVFQCGWKVLWSKSLETSEEVRIAFRYYQI